MTIVNITPELVTKIINDVHNNVNVTDNYAKAISNLLIVSLFHFVNLLIKSNL